VRVKVLFFGLIRRHVGGKNEEVELPEGATVGDLIATLTREHGPEFRDNLINSDGTVKAEVFITVDGYNVASREGLNTMLAPGAESHIVLVGPVVTGGQD
jgi:molybdopterin converting factor small subunit